MYSCFNVVVNERDKPEVVLIRALEPFDGINLMQKRRNKNQIIDLCNGPGKLCTALNISRENYGDDLCGDNLYIEDRAKISNEKISVSPRINIDYAEECRDCYWRYYVNGNRYVSKVPQRYQNNSKPFEC